MCSADLPNLDHPTFYLKIVCVRRYVDADCSGCWELLVEMTQRTPHKRMVTPEIGCLWTLVAMLVGHLILR